ncbi:MAG: DNA-processing protein DprA [Patescibacteria group bacterium]
MEHKNPEKYPIRQLSVDQLPRQLAEITGRPKRLYSRGDESLLHRYVEGAANTAGGNRGRGHKLLCVIGSRQYTPYGREACEAIIAGLRDYPITIVSGLALGIDGIAHEAALRAGLKTVAVLGSGLDDNSIYPPSNQHIARRILAEGGCLVSENPPGTRPAPYHFPARNRIMSGLSHATLVIEARRPSGTLITSQLATDQNRDILAVPGSIFSEHAAGPHYLIGKGATPVTCAHDVLVALGFAVEKIRGRGKANGTKNHTLTAKLADLTIAEKMLLGILDRPRTRDEIIRELGWSASETNVTLSLLEIKELIVAGFNEIRKK